MAPLQPAPHRSSRPAKSILKTSGDRVAKARKEEPLFSTNKKDKRRIKHSQLMSKVTKAQTPKLRRRRPNKKLVTTLDTLADALPDDGDHFGEVAAGETPEQQVNVIRRKSMKSKPGALKRKQKLDNEERARFAKNMAQLSANAPIARSNGTSGVEKSDLKPASSSNQRWTALRGFISQTLEKKPEFTQTGT